MEEAQEHLAPIACPRINDLQAGRAILSAFSTKNQWFNDKRRSAAVLRDDWIGRGLWTHAGLTPIAGRCLRLGTLRTQLRRPLASSMGTAATVSSEKRTENFTAF